MKKMFYNVKTQTSNGEFCCGWLLR